MLDKAKEWFFGFALKKAAVRVAAAIAALAVSHGPGKFGVNIVVDPDVLAVSLIGGFEVLRNWLKVKKGVTWL